MHENGKEIITSENIILAGTKVMDKSGGPHMAIVCFSADRNLVYNQKFKTPVFLKQKVFVNKERKTINELSNSANTNNNIYIYIFFRDIYSEIKFDSYCSGSDTLYIICKYWSSQDNDFLYVNKTLPELETI